jgi:PTH1 family peptidyl-tRNA hydrolase
MPAPFIKLIVGLGNPGDEYARTRHNVGFWFVEELARRYGGTFRNEPKHHGELARVRIGESEIWLLKPMSYMNRSGGPTRSVASFYKIAPEEILVAYDELDFPPGTARLKFGGGAAGHNGVRDIIAQIGEGFWRLRVGIGKPPVKGPSHVLSRASAEEDRAMRESLAAAADVIPTMVEQGGQKAMNRLHTRPAPSADAAPDGNK